ncbi:unnamed protein product [Fusarium graminearum]|uniref:Chromosome 2, complete genome n=2 Tax=Gibberella zeae (strain ATCC MYA-4620 / CBS 123657 / FGSC 9075 / NRRL 31084 / PH-1) TaxID=229533 RepID=A0A098DNX8_GIBZE|nr:unnamed protein product [Fusarium graminearum]
MPLLNRASPSLDFQGVHDFSGNHRLWDNTNSIFKLIVKVYVSDANSDRRFLASWIDSFLNCDVHLERSLSVGSGALCAVVGSQTQDSTFS